MPAERKKVAQEPRRAWVAFQVSLLPVLLVGTLSAGCRIVQTTAELPGRAVSTVTQGKQEKEGVDPVELQQTLLRFADEFSARMIIGVERLRRASGIIEPAENLRWKIGFGTAISSIATGPNAYANVLDMTVFVTVTRMALQEHWQPEVFGETAGPMLESCRRAETNIWQLAGNILKPEQKAELREAIAAWYRQNPLPESILAARAVGFASQVAQTKSAASAKTGSVFSLLHLDPLSSLDPATREIALARLFAERALYLAHRMPMLLRWQTELLALETTELPVVQQLVTNSTQLTASAERFTTVADRLPGQLSAEREQILKTLESQEGELAALAGEVRQTLQAGSQMSASVNTTLTTFDAVMERFGVGGTNSAPTTGSEAEPFRIADYKETAAQLQATARELTGLLLTLDRTVGSTNMTQLSAQARTGTRIFVDYVFWRAVLFVAIVLVAALIYRLLATRITATRSNGSST